MKVNGVPMIQHIAQQLASRFSDCYISTNDPDTYSFLGLPAVADEVPGKGPLMGIAAGMNHSPWDWNFFIAADIPDPPLQLVDELYRHRDGHTAIVPLTTSGHYQPLFAFYHRSLLQPIQTAMASDQRHAHLVRELAQSYGVPIDDSLLKNINTFHDYRALKNINRTE
tara:strand:- start:226 stop:729 length:504 start_codon:yes stop_codon:yes gene_type:complete